MKGGKAIYARRSKNTAMITKLKKYKSVRIESMSRKVWKLDCSGLVMHLPLALQGDIHYKNDFQ